MGRAKFAPPADRPPLMGITRCHFAARLLGFGAGGIQQVRGGLLRWSDRRRSEAAGLGGAARVGGGPPSVCQPLGPRKESGRMGLLKAGRAGRKPRLTRGEPALLLWARSVYAGARPVGRCVQHEEPDSP